MQRQSCGILSHAEYRECIGFNPNMYPEYTVYRGKRFILPCGTSDKVHSHQIEGLLFVMCVNYECQYFGLSVTDGETAFEGVLFFDNPWDIEEFCKGYDIINFFDLGKNEQIMRLIDHYYNK